jgi:hypothetical protein
MCDCCLTPNKQFVSNIMARTSCMRWDDDLFSASSLKQKSSGRYVAQLGYIILIPSQLIFVLTPNGAYLAVKNQMKQQMLILLLNPKISDVIAVFITVPH